MGCCCCGVENCKSRNGNDQSLVRHRFVSQKTRVFLWNAIGESEPLSRRDVGAQIAKAVTMLTATVTGAAAVVTPTPGSAAIVAAATITDQSLQQPQEDTGMAVMKTQSGLRYIDIQPGSGDTPSYGNLLSISYKAYIKLPVPDDSKPQLFDQCDGYLLKHGNGRTLAGLDEGLHTMRVNGERRILIPPKLGFVDVGLGPLPEMPWNRAKLNYLLEQMIAQSGGTIIYQVQLKGIVEDEADLGYYQDGSLTPEEFARLRENLRIKGNEELQRQANENAMEIKGQDRLL